MVTTESFVFDRVPVPFGNCLVCCFDGGERTCCCCLDVVVLLLIVVVDVDGRVFCETIAEYCRTGNVVVAVVITGYAKCGGALVESIEADDGAEGKIGFDDDNTLGDCCGNCEGTFGDGLFAPELDLDKKDNVFF